MTLANVVSVPFPSFNHHPAILLEEYIVMRFLENFLRHELAIDLGTVNTIIYDPGKGVLLNEPSVVAIDRYDGEVLSVGREALKLLGREPRGGEVHRPVRGSAIYDFD